MIHVNAGLYPINGQAEIVFPMVASSDHISLITGRTLTIKWYAVGVEIATTGTWGEIASGMYSYTPGVGEFGVTGAFTLLVTATGADPTVISIQIGFFNPYSGTAKNLGIPALPNVTFGTTGGVAGWQGASPFLNLDADGSVEVAVNNDKSNYTLHSTALTDIAAAVFNATVASFSTAGTFGKYLQDLVNNVWAKIAPVQNITVLSILDGKLDEAISTKSELTTADVINGVNQALNVANPELTTMPSTTATLRGMIQFLFQYFHNKRTVTVSTEAMYKDDSVSVLGTAAVSDDGTTVTKGKIS